MIRMKKISQTLVGTFGQKKVHGDLFIDQAGLLPQTLVVFFHGCCGTVYDHELTTYQLLAPMLTEEHGISSAIFETSRNIRKIDVDPQKVDFQNYTREAFGSKSFEQELHDARFAVSSLLKTATVEMRATPRCIFVGFSMGGIVATLLSEEFAPRHLFMFGSALNFNVPKDLPILGQGLTKKEQKMLVLAAQNYKGSVTLTRGSADDTALQDQSLKLFHYYNSAEKRTYQEWKGVDHRFKQKHDKGDPGLIKQLKEVILTGVFE